MQARPLRAAPTTAFTVDTCQGRDLVGVLHPLERAGVQLERVTRA